MSSGKRYAVPRAFVEEFRADHGLEDAPDAEVLAAFADAVGLEAEAEVDIVDAETVRLDQPATFRCSGCGCRGIIPAGAIVARAFLSMDALCPDCEPWAALLAVGERLLSAAPDPPDFSLLPPEDERQ